MALFTFSAIIFGYSPFFIITIFIIIGAVTYRSSLFFRFKDDYYPEYQQWQGFKKYLSTLDSMKRSPPQGVILWEKYLVYATALGIGKKVLQTLKDLKIIDKNTYDNFCIIYMPSSFGATNASSGGAGGMGGGGVGGGGGGGR